MSVSATAHEHGEHNHFTIEHLPKVQHAGNITVAPNGKLSAYTLSVPRDMTAGNKDGRADTHLYILDEKGTSRLFIGGEGSISSLSFNQASDTLYFRAKRGDDKYTSLYAISVNGGEAYKMFGFETAIGDYEVVNDTLFFVAKAKDDAQDFKDKGFNAKVFEEDTRLNQLWSVSIKGGEATSIFSGGHVSDIDVSSDGEFVIAAVAPTNLVDDSLMERNIHTIQVSSGEITNTIDMPGKLGEFVLHSNDEDIAIIGGADISDSSDGVLMVAQADSAELTQLTADALQHIVDIAWKGRDILAVAHRGVESSVAVYDKKGKVKRTINTSEDIVVRSVAVGDDTVRLIADSPAHPRAVFAVNRNKARKVTQHNTWLKDIALAPQSTFMYEARDGEKVEGLLITPKSEAPEKGWPLILMVHGGPEAHYSDGWLTAYSMPGQYAAAKGYAVYYPNYRGSTGRGVAYAKQHQNDYAGKEFNDLVDGVDALAKAGIIDRDRVGITGGSYGGYASMWGATALTEHFAAAVAFVGISNQVSKFGTSDIPNEMHLVHSLKWPWEDNWMNLLERSPIFHAGKADTPILILHGEKDTRVHPSQSMELYRSIKVRTDTPVRLVFYPNEGHGNRHAAAQYDYALRLMRWMDTYLAEHATRQTAKPPFDLGLADKLKKED
ncbi:MAG: prolyl oligopeptidase family serine peptidase [Alteromonadaceae bacterium]|nr:prolyl oligopeptidase family serine peptidase [Alteromonadaceae bacterium]